MFSKKGHSSIFAEEWNWLLHRYIGTVCLGLEIGCYEGRATCWFCEHIMNNPQSQLHVIDTFQGSKSHILEEIDCSKMLENFKDNTKRWKDKIRIHQGTSYSQLARWASGLEGLLNPNWIYIDGSHMACDVLSDLCMAWPILQKNGIMVLDDYEWHPWPAGNEIREPKIAIDSFLKCYEGQYHLIYKNYQVALEKTI